MESWTKTWTRLSTYAHTHTHTYHQVSQFKVTVLLRASLFAGPLNCEQHTQKSYSNFLTENIELWCFFLGHTRLRVIVSSGHFPF